MIYMYLDKYAQVDSIQPAKLHRVPFGQQREMIVMVQPLWSLGADEVV